MFFSKYVENETRRLFSDFLFFFKKKKEALYEVKASGMQLSANVFQ